MCLSSQLAERKSLYFRVNVAYMSREASENRRIAIHPASSAIYHEPQGQTEMLPEEETDCTKEEEEDKIQIRIR